MPGGAAVACGRLIELSLVQRAASPLGRAWPPEDALVERVPAQGEAPLRAAVDDERRARCEARGVAREVERRADELVRLPAAAQRERLPLLVEGVVVPAAGDVG